MRDLRDAVRALAGHLNRVAARSAGGIGQLRAVLVEVVETPACHAVTGGAERHRCAGVRIGVLAVKGHLIAHVGLCDGHGRGADLGFVELLFQTVIDRVRTGFGEHGLVCAVLAVCGCSIAHRNVRCGDGQVNAVRLAVIHAGIAGGGVRELPRNDAERMVNHSAVAVAIAHHLDPVVARKGGRGFKRRVVVTVDINDLPPVIIELFVGRRELHSLAGVRVALLLVEDYLVADVNKPVLGQRGCG